MGGVGAALDWVSRCSAIKVADGSHQQVMAACQAGSVQDYGLLGFVGSDNVAFVCMHGHE
jgi:hypothetical protein